MNHANIIRYCNRPFLREGDLTINGKWTSMEIAHERCMEMNNLIISRCNERVKENDLLYNIGDVGFRSKGNRGEGEPEKLQLYLDKLICKNIIYIEGNHDRHAKNSFKIINQKIFIKYGGKRICLVHDPEYADVNCEINLVGHIHNLWQIKRIRKGFSFTDCINVGVDVWNFYPVTWNEIWQRYVNWLKTV